jgi:hypothetical protein
VPPSRCKQLFDPAHENTLSTRTQRKGHTLSVITFLTVYLGTSEQYVHNLPALIDNGYHEYAHAWAYFHFKRPEAWVLMPILLYFASKWGQRQFVIRHSSLSPHQNLSDWRGLRNRASVLVCLGYLSLFGCTFHLGMAMLGPTVPEKQVEQVIETRNICMWVDTSGSMKSVYLDGVNEFEEQPSAGASPAIKLLDGGNGKLLVPGKKPDEAPHQMTRVEAAQMAALHFIKVLMTHDINHTNRFCEWRFDLDSYIVAPLSTDQDVMIVRTEELSKDVGGSTNFGGPCAGVSAIGPLRKQYDYFVKYTKANSVRVDIFTTDGLDEIPKTCRDDLVQKFLEAHIRLYVIGLGDRWKKGDTLDLEKFADELKLAHGNASVYHTANPGEMTKAMNEIGNLEKAQEVIQKVQIDREVDEVFIVVAIGFGLMFLGFANLAGRNP